MTFDCLNANRINTQFEFKSVYRTQLDGRLHWLENDFLKYFQDWKDWAMGQEDVPLGINRCHDSLKEFCKLKQVTKELTGLNC